MIWSRYSHLFESKKNGWLLYNSASNSFLQLEKKVIPTLEKIIESPNDYDYSKIPDLYFHLRNGGFLVEDTKDDDLFNILKMRRLTSNYASNTLLLTIAPTRACNFACPYCFESNRTVSMMTDKTQNNIIEFIKKHKSINKLSIIWYGGEPLIAFDRIKSLNNEISKLGKKYSSVIVSNGYLFTDEIINELDTLKTNLIQITLDGKKETHDSRRHLIGGGETFDKIITNIDKLMNSKWKGHISIRVNIDSSNQDEFVNVYSLLKEKYGDDFVKKISVYPGFVHGEENPDTCCYFNSDDKGRFLTELSKKYNINTLPLFPKTVIGGCTMTKRNAYVIGPEGELYKCWNDVGIKEMVIGSIDSFLDWNMSLVADGMVNASYLDDEECKKCFFFPICDGGCAKYRLKNIKEGKKWDNCSYYKNHLEEMLELHYEQKILDKDKTIKNG